MIEARIAISIFGRNRPQLEEFLVFSVCVAGKTAVTTARAVNALLRTLRREHGRLSPLALIRATRQPTLRRLLREHGIGCHALKSRSLKDLARLDLDLKTCSVDELEAVHGVGPKTARFFMLHTRRDARVAALDTHILKHLRANGIKAPMATPAPGRTYRLLEQAFLKLADEAKMAPAVYDYAVWRSYATAM